MKEREKVSTHANLTKQAYSNRLALRTEGQVHSTCQVLHSYSLTLLCMQKPGKNRQLRPCVLSVPLISEVPG